MSVPSLARALAGRYLDGDAARDCCFVDRLRPVRNPGSAGVLQREMFAFGTDTDLRCTWSLGEPIGPLTAATNLAAHGPPGSVGDENLAMVAALQAAVDGRRVTHRIVHHGSHLQVCSGPVFDVAGAVAGTVTVSIDLTWSDAARLREHRAEERFRRLVDHSPALIGVRDADERVVQANPAFLHVFTDGITDAPEPDDPGGQDGHGELGETVRRVLRSGEPRVWEGILRQAGGETIHLLGHVFPLPFVDGSVGVGQMFLDLTPQDTVRGELAASEQRYRAIFDGADICIILLDLDGRIVDANAASKRFTGRSRSELRGRFVGAVTTRADTEAHQASWEELRTGRRSRYDRPMTLRHSDGSLSPAHLTMTLIRDEAGRPSGGLGLATPLSVDQAPVRARRDRDLMTGPQIAVLERLAAGEPIRQIAHAVGLTRRGVDYRVAQLRRKLRDQGSNEIPATTAALVARAYALGILLPSVWPPTVVSAWRDTAARTP